MEFKGKTEKEQTEELAAALFAKFRFGTGNFTLRLCAPDDSIDVIINDEIRAQVVRAGSGEYYHRNRARNLTTTVSPIYQVCSAIEHKIFDKKHPNNVQKYSDIDKLVLLVLCEMSSGAFTLLETHRKKITECINTHFEGKKIFQEIWAVHRKENPIKVIKLYP
ncbi:MAG: hypothetical protein M0025_05325 [Elusimicrobia bacterium]|nr:hypothetical protein [Elusimicrobiota bacterium]